MRLRCFATFSFLIFAIVMELSSLEDFSTKVAVCDYVRCIFVMRSRYLLLGNVSEMFLIGTLKIYV